MNGVLGFCTAWRPPTMAGVLIGFTIPQGGGGLGARSGVPTHPPTAKIQLSSRLLYPVPTPPHPLRAHLGAKDMQGGCELAVLVYYKYTPKNFPRDWADAKNLSKGGGV